MGTTLLATENSVIQLICFSVLKLVLLEQNGLPSCYGKYSISISVYKAKVSELGVKKVQHTLEENVNSAFRPLGGAVLNTHWL